MGFAAIAAKIRWYSAATTPLQGRGARIHSGRRLSSSHHSLRERPRYVCRISAKEWNQAHGERFVFHYTPTHGSWLNQVELWFSILTRRVLRYGEFGSPDELVRTIERFIEHWNRDEAKPFRWTYEGRPLVSA